MSSPPANNPSSKAGGGTNCDCSNALKEVSYTVKLEPDGSKYKIKDIEAAVVNYKGAIAGVCGVKTTVKQSFSINFVSDTTKIVQKKSGNLGYLDGYPLKLGYIDAAD